MYDDKHKLKLKKIETGDAIEEPDGSGGAIGQLKIFEVVLSGRWMSGNMTICSALSGFFLPLRKRSQLQ